MYVCMCVCVCVCVYVLCIYMHTYSYTNTHTHTHTHTHIDQVRRLVAGLRALLACGLAHCPLVAWLQRYTKCLCVVNILGH